MTSGGSLHFEHYANECKFCKVLGEKLDYKFIGTQRVKLNHGFRIGYKTVRVKLGISDIR